MPPSRNEYHRLRQSFVALSARPSKIVESYFCDRPLLDTHPALLKHSFPLAAGGQKNGWWTNGRDLLYKDMLIATRLVFCSEIHVHPDVVDLFKHCKMLKGLHIFPLPFRPEYPAADSSAHLGETLQNN